MLHLKIEHVEFVNSHRIYDLENKIVKFDIFNTSKETQKFANVINQNDFLNQPYHTNNK